MDNAAASQHVNLSPAPGWMIKQMGGQEGQTSGVRTQAPSALERLSSHCEVFADHWETQKNVGLDEEYWFKWSSLLVHSAGLDTASVFSKASIKHDEHSESRLRQMQISEKIKLVKCKTFGCSEQDIEQCFYGKLRKNEAGVVINSPGAFLKGVSTSGSHTLSKPINLKQIGFELAPNSGKICGLNGNIYARHILQHRLDLIYSSDRFYVYESSVWKQKDGNAISRILRSILHEYAPDFWTPGFESIYISALKVEAPRVVKMDLERNFINLLNGMVDLRNYKLVAHDEKYHSSIQIPIVYDPDAECPTFLQFLEDVFQNDKELIQLTAEMLGYCLTVKVKAQKAFILYGNGSNGKSVLADILKKLCGIENISSVSLNELDNSFARAEIVDKLLNLATENEVGSSGFNTQYFKSIVSGDPIRVERKHEQGFTYEPYCKLVFALNKLPYAKDKSHGFLRRLVIIPFDRTFSEKEANFDLMDDLTCELPGILNFALEGLKRLEDKHYRFTESKASREILKEYMEELNPVDSFVEEMIEKGGLNDRVKNKSIGDTFRIWCLEQGHSALAQYSQVRLIRNIKDVLKSKGIKASKGNAGSGRYLTGIKLKTIVRATLDGYETVGEIDEID